MWLVAPDPAASRHRRARAAAGADGRRLSGQPSVRPLQAGKGNEAAGAHRHRSRRRRRSHDSPPARPRSRRFAARRLMAREWVNLPSNAKPPRELARADRP
ncbi:MAG: hypothetical protein MZV70_18745 [Desulfobacterales bacterium]|nr:hypothetical protein [Desulfobacterales bacterium]